MLFEYDIVKEYDDEKIDTKVYDADYSEVKSALAEILTDTYFNAKTLLENKSYSDVKYGIKSMIDDLDLVDDLAEQYKDELKDYFEDYVR